MAESWGDKLKNTAHKVVLASAVLSQSVMVMAQKVSAAYKDSLQKSPDEIPVAPTQSATNDDMNVTAFENYSAPENTDAVLDAQEANVAEAVPEKSPIQQKYGFDVVYDTEENRFLLKQDGLYDRGMREDFVDYESWAENLQKHRSEKYSHDTVIKFEDVDLKEHLEKGRYIYIARQKGDNSIDVFQYNVKPEDRAECLQLLQGEDYGLSKEAAEKLFAIMTTTDLNEKISLIEHESGHSRDEVKAKLDQFDLPPYRMAQLEMLTEVHAYMEQAGFALDMYKGTGNLKYFDNINLNMDELKTKLAENPNMENKEGAVASYVFEEFMKEHNKEGSTYSDQVYALTNPSGMRTDYRVWSYVDNEASTEEYHRRVSNMFDNVGGLGDVRQYINPDFELHKELKSRLMDNGILNKNFLAVMAENADKPQEYAQNLQDFLQKIKEIDADGIRTKEETKELDEIIQRATTPKTDTVQKEVKDNGSEVKEVPTSDKERIAALSGRSGKYQSPESLAEEKAQIQQKTMEEKPLEQTPLEQTTPKQASLTPQKASESLQQMPEQPLEMPQTKKVADMSNEEKYDFINNNLRKGKNPNLVATDKSEPVKDNVKTASNTLSQQQVAQAMMRRNAGNGM